jgi:hypothetical protein
MTHLELEGARPPPNNGGGSPELRSSFLDGFETKNKASLPKEQATPPRQPSRPRLSRAETKAREAAIEKRILKVLGRLGRAEGRAWLAEFYAPTAELLHQDRIARRVAKTLIQKRNGQANCVRMLLDDELFTRYPATTFSVDAMTDLSLKIRWVRGPSEETISKIVRELGPPWLEDRPFSFEAVHILRGARRGL